jgi:signal transduction histidine kinase
VRSRSVVAATAGVVVVGLSLLAAWGRWSNRDVPGTEFASGFWTLLVGGGLGYGAAGGWLATLRPRLPLGWLMLLVAAALGVGAAGQEYAIATVDRHPDWPGAGGALWLAVWTWVVGYLTVALVLPLVLPEGRLASPRHRWLVGLAVLALTLTAALFALTPYDELVPPVVLGDLRNPVGAGWWDAPWLQVPSLLLTLGALACGLVVLVRRWRRASGERAALSTTMLGLLATLVVGLVAFLVPDAWVPAVLALATVPLPVSCLVAVLRHGLGDVDVVLSRALAYASLSGLAAGTYVVLVTLLGGLLGAGTGLPELVTAALTAVVALAVAPSYRRVQRLVNRVVHGDPEEPYAALAALGRRLESALDPQAVAEQMLPSLVTALSRAVHAPVALALRDGSVVRAGEPRAGARRVPLTYAGEHLGELVVDAGSPLSSRQQRLLDDLGRQAAVAVHGVLLGRALALSREQIVRAREDERRRLRADLHDGVGPTLAAAALQVETARHTYASDPERAGALLDTVAARLSTAVDDVRQVVRGLRPAGLDDLGLPDALSALARQFDGPGRSVVARVGPLPERSAAVDAAVYLVAAEAVTNAVRHGDAREVRIEIAPRDGGLVLCVEDDGCGVDATRPPGTGLWSMRERVEQLAGRFVVEAAPRRGTRVLAWLPTEPS